MRDVAAAVGALLDGDPNLLWFDGQVGDTAGRPYVVFYLTTPSPRGERLSGDAPLGLYSLSTLYVGSKPNECRWVAERVHAALDGKRLTVPARTTTPLALGTSAQIRPDDGINPPAYVGTDVWRFTITRGAPDA